MTFLPHLVYFGRKMEFLIVTKTLLWIKPEPLVKNGYLTNSSFFSGSQEACQISTQYDNFFESYRAYRRRHENLKSHFLHKTSYDENVKIEFFEAIRVDCPLKSFGRRLFHLTWKLTSLILTS